MPVPVRKFAIIGGAIAVFILLAIVGLTWFSTQAPRPSDQTLDSAPQTALPNPPQAHPPANTDSERKHAARPPSTARPTSAPPTSAPTSAPINPESERTHAAKPPTTAFPTAAKPHHSKTPIETALDQNRLGTGIIEYNPPSTMTADQPVVVTVRIRAPETDAASLPPILENSGPIQQHKAETYEEMNVELKGLEGDALKVELKNGGPQVVRSGFADWTWSVTANKQGTWHLEMDVFAIVYLPGRPPSRKPIKTETTSITVTVVPLSTGQKVKRFVSHNWQFLWEKVLFGSFGTGLALGLMGLIRKLIRKRGARKPGPSSDDASGAEQKPPKKGSKTAA